MMMTSYNNFVAELLVIIRGIYDGWRALDGLR
jgi:hypothetical protein